MVYLIKYESLAKNGMLTDRQIEKVVIIGRQNDLNGCNVLLHYYTITLLKAKFGCIKGLPNVILLRNDTLSWYARFVRHWLLTIYNVDKRFTACYLSSCNVKSGKMTNFKNRLFWGAKGQKTAMGAQNERKTSDVIVVSHVQAEFSLNKRSNELSFFSMRIPR